jgi:hypothetical protein
MAPPPNGDDDTSSGSSRFPPRRCPACRGHEGIPCELCNGTTFETRVVSRFKAAAYLANHPEIRDTPGEFPSVFPPPKDGESK